MFLFQALISFFCNSNTFKFTVATIPIFHIGFYAMQLDLQLKEYYDPYSGRLFEDSDELKKLFRTKILYFTLVVFLFTAHTWLTQYDVITHVI